MMFVEMKSEEMTWKYPKYSVKVWMACRMNLSTGNNFNATKTKEKQLAQCHLSSSTVVGSKVKFLGKLGSVVWCGVVWCGGCGGRGGW
jgi:hypothetical protein